MASIVQRNKSFSVVYTIYDGEKKRQKWETYHSYGAALRRKEQLDLIQQLEKERTQYQEDTLAQFLEEYVELYGQVHWACSTYTSNEGLIRNYIIPFMGSMRLTEFTPKVIAVLYGKLQSDPKISPSVLTNIHKLLRCREAVRSGKKCLRSTLSRRPQTRTIRRKWRQWTKPKRGF